MSAIKLILGNRIHELLLQNGRGNILAPEKIASLLSICKSGLEVDLQLPIQEIDKTTHDFKNNLKNFPTDDLFYLTEIVSPLKNPHASFKLNRNNFISDVLFETKNPPKQMISEPLMNVIEFSSPNIAKPFHVGHLRSTIIGNFIANLKSHLGHNVIRLNYLGDWGTQYGFLKIGIDMLGITNDDLRQNPIEILYKAYVAANSLAESDPKIRAKARDIFTQLEDGTFSDTERWKMIRKYTVDELERTYGRLGVKFDAYHWESMYSAKDITEVISLMELKQILSLEPDGKRTVKIDDRRVPIMKSDGSTLYLTRDLAAAIDRQNSYKFDNMYYIVDNAQTDHFKALFSIEEQLNLAWAGKCQHVKFGRIRGMSTRKGQTVFLKDILDEAQDKMRNKQLESPTTRIDVTGTESDTADILGISAVIINDLKQRRTRDYDFDWDKVLQTNGDSGVRLQYTHCRLHSLEQNCGISEIPENCDPCLLPEPIVLQLAYEIIKFSDILTKADKDLEACTLVVYLFGLCNIINKALKVLQVKNMGAVGEQRLLLFHCARVTLKQGMEILGLKPLNEM